MQPVDKYGHCLKCGKNLIIKKTFEGKERTMLSNLYDTKEYRLSDSSKMKVVICTTCKPSITDDDKVEIMASVIKGWEAEMSLVKWDQSKKDEYMAKYSQLTIQ